MRFTSSLAAIAAFASFAGVAGAATNLPPTISGSPATVMKVKTSYDFRPVARDPEGRPLKFSVVNKPGWMVVAPNSGQLMGYPKTPGVYRNIQLRVTDGKNVVSLPAFTLTITATGSSAAAPVANRAPKIGGTPSSSATVGTAYNFQPSASDADGNSLGFTIQNRPSWAAFSTSTGRLSGTPTASGSFGNIVISVSDGKATTRLPAFSITVSGTSNRAPVISGTPAGSVNAGSAYSFRPSASDADGNKLSYSIANRPSWATFSSSTGQLSGTPSASQVGSYGNIKISVSDGKATASLAAFSINVVDISNSDGAGLSWTAPTENTDGSALTNLAGYRISYGTSANALTQTVQVANPSVTRYTIENLSPGTYYFSVRAYTSGGTESASSNVTSKVVR